MLLEVCVGVECNVFLFFIFILTACCAWFRQTQTNIPIFKLKESTVRRRYSEFEWLKRELERDSKVCCLQSPSPPNPLTFCGGIGVV